MGKSAASRTRSRRWRLILGFDPWTGHARASIGPGILADAGPGVAGAQLRSRQVTALSTEGVRRGGRGRGGRSRGRPRAAGPSRPRLGARLPRVLPHQRGLGHGQSLRRNAGRGPAHHPGSRRRAGADLPPARHRARGRQCRRLPERAHRPGPRHGAAGPDQPLLLSLDPVPERRVRPGSRRREGPGQAGHGRHRRGPLQPPLLRRRRRAAGALARLDRHPARAADQRRALRRLPGVGVAELPGMGPFPAADRRAAGRGHPAVLRAIRRHQPELGGDRGRDLAGGQPRSRCCWTRARCGCRDGGAAPRWRPSGSASSGRWGRS